MAALIVLVLGFVCAFVGVALLSVPVALIALGVCSALLAIFVDFDTFGRGRK